jgi:hypothetical protein
MTPTAIKIGEVNIDSQRPQIDAIAKEMKAAIFTALEVAKPLATKRVGPMR